MKTPLIFLSASHKTRFLQAMHDLGKVDHDILDSEYGACLYILSADLGTWNAAQPYITRHGIRIDLLLKAIICSSGEEVLLLLAGNLFNGNEHVDPVELMRLDPHNFALALSAIVLRRSGYRESDLLAIGERSILGE